MDGLANVGHHDRDYAGLLAVDDVPTAVMLYAVTFVLRFALAVAATAAFVAVVESLPMRVRSGALSVIYALALSVFGGSTQFVVAWLAGLTGNPLAPAWYMFGAALLGLVAMALTRETAPVKLKGGAARAMSTK